MPASTAVMLPSSRAVVAEEVERGVHAVDVEDGVEVCSSSGSFFGRALRSGMGVEGCYVEEWKYGKSANVILVEDVHDWAPGPLALSWSKHITICNSYLAGTSIAGAGVTGVAF